MAESRQGKFFRNEIKEITILIILGLTVAIIIPMVVGFGFRLFEESLVPGRPLAFGDFLTNYIIYFVLILAGLIGLPILKIRELYVNDNSKHVAEQENPKHLAVGLIHDPERQSLLFQLFESLGFKGKKNPIRWQLSIFRTFIIGILIFGSIGLYQSITQTTFSAIPQMPFQVSKLGDVVFSVEPPAFSETYTMFFVMSLILGELAWLISKLKARRWTYYILAIFIVCPIIALLWMGFHNIVYGNNEAALTVTFFFALVGSITAVLFGTTFYWYIFHVMNNLFVKLSMVATHNEDIWFITAIILFILLFLWITYEIIRWKYKKKKEYVPTTPT